MGIAPLGFFFLLWEMYQLMNVSASMMAAMAAANKRATVKLQFESGIQLGKSNYWSRLYLA
eukprot:CAMPEP_0170558202 /NCGR_PEP_ID=MMETSP0211-20121228/33585_1 /TAXON_ID=311385 /ORGANISM="Pseudokeronopsis sp., Strain OXSARD2" /LENGTH=60 /DNA_ID=CAMNT_0010869935 /DNA_START=263 /DNA_END=442 /DNA_ORIENTATION=-